MIVFDENLFCGKLFNDVINLPLNSFMEKYGKNAKSVNKDTLNDQTEIELDDYTTLTIHSDIPDKINSCLYSVLEKSKIEQFMESILNDSRFKYNNLPYPCNSFDYYPNNIDGLVRISIFYETIFNYFDLTISVSYTNN